MKTDLYKVLGVERNADDKKLKAAYRRLAKRYHPDMNPGDGEAERRFKEIGEAYAILSDPEKRKIYDAYGMEAFESGNPEQYRDMREQYASGGFGGAPGDGASFRTFHFDGNDAEELFRSMFGDLFGGAEEGGRRGRGGRRIRFGGDGFDGGDFGDFGGFDDGGREDFRSGVFRGGSGSGRPGSAFREADLRTSLTVSFAEAALGAARKIRLPAGEGPGEGGILEVQIPAGIEEGRSLRLRGKGRTGPDGRRGDLLIRIHIAEDPVYSRKGDDVYITAEIPYATAVLGGEAEVPTIHGRVSCRIPAGTQCGSTIRLRGKGIRRKGASGPAGDEYVKIGIEIPKKISPEAAGRLREFERTRNGGRRGGHRREDSITA